MLTVLQHIPDGLMRIKSIELHRIVPELTLVKIQGKKKQPLVLSCMLHGNEHTGLLVVQKLLKKFGIADWPRSVYVLFGNVLAAKDGRRHLDDQPDYNRIWGQGDLPIQQKAVEVLDFLKIRNPFASIDIHNNSGRNPCYTVLLNKTPVFLNLAALFGKLSLYFDIPQTSFSDSMARVCPALTIEAGTPGHEEGVDRVCEYIEALFHLDEIPHTPVSKQDLSLFGILGRVTVPQEAQVGFGNESGQFVFEKDFDLKNFKEIPTGSCLGLYKEGMVLGFTDSEGNEVSKDYLDYQDGKIITKQTLIPCMITLDKKILKSDCLCYMLKEIERS